MKIASLVVATSLALVPAASALAGDEKKAEVKEAKADAAAKKAAAAAAKKKAADATRALQDEARRKAGAAGAAATATVAKSEEDVAAERDTHAKNLGAIERLQQIADATNDADLLAAVARLNEKETKRHGMAAGG